MTLLVVSSLAVMALLIISSLAAMAMLAASRRANRANTVFRQDSSGVERDVFFPFLEFFLFLCGEEGADIVVVRDAVLHAPAANVAFAIPVRTVAVVTTSGL
jgi:uncharacterized membrane protein